MHITDLDPADSRAIQQAATILVAGFRGFSWPDLESALAEIHKALESGKICRAAYADDRTMLGWIGGIPQYDGNVWELHPLVVAPEYQGQGIGRALVSDFEAQVRMRNGITIVLGSDDIDSTTTLSGIDLYPDVWRHVQTVRNLRGHPYSFYEKCGFVITGVVPDANGFGKPDILMAKRVYHEARNL